LACASARKKRHRPSWNAREAHSEAENRADPALTTPEPGFWAFMLLRCRLR
jgi:hypothetical protein